MDTGVPTHTPLSSVALEHPRAQTWGAPLCGEVESKPLGLGEN